MNKLKNIFSVIFVLVHNLRVLVFLPYFGNFGRLNALHVSFEQYFFVLSHEYKIYKGTL